MAALAKESLQKKNTFQVLDDCGYLGKMRDTVAFYTAYNGVGASVKVRMAPPGDPDKSFECDTSGCITTRWTGLGPSAGGKDPGGTP